MSHFTGSVEPDWDADWSPTGGRWMDNEMFWIKMQQPEGGPRYLGAWAASTSYVNWVSFILEDGFYFGNFGGITGGSQTSGGTEPDWTTAEGNGDFISDNTFQWYNNGLDGGVWQPNYEFPEYDESYSPGAPIACRATTPRTPYDVFFYGCRRDAPLLTVASAVTDHVHLEFETLSTFPYFYLPLNSDEFVIYRDTSPGATTLLASGASILNDTYDDYTAVPGVVYFYRVTFRGDYGEETLLSNELASTLPPSPGGGGGGIWVQEA